VQEAPEGMDWETSKLRVSGGPYPGGCTGIPVSQRILPASAPPQSRLLEELNHTKLETVQGPAGQGGVDVALAEVVVLEDVVLLDVEEILLVVRVVLVRLVDVVVDLVMELDVVVDVELEVELDTVLVLVPDLLELVVVVDVVVPKVLEVLELKLLVVEDVEALGAGQLAS
jgi:hypothetical protein